MIDGVTHHGPVKHITKSWQLPHIAGLDQRGMLWVMRKVSKHSGCHRGCTRFRRGHHALGSHLWRLSQGPWQVSRWIQGADAVLRTVFCKETGDALCCIYSI